MDQESTKSFGSKRRIFHIKKSDFTDQKSVIKQTAGTVGSFRPGVLGGRGGGETPCYC